MMHTLDYFRRAGGDGFFLVKLSGGSMFPTLRSQDKVMLKRVAFGDLRLRDIIVFRQNGFKVCHRIIKIDRLNLRLYTRGDANAKGAEVVKPQDIIGRAAAVICGSKFYPLGFQNTLVYYKAVNLLACFKAALIFWLDKFYGLAFLRKLLKQLNLGRIECRHARDERDSASFDAFYNVLPRNQRFYSVHERLLGFCAGRPAAKLWILKDSQGYWFWGPYVKLLYRGCGVGRRLVEQAQKEVLAKEPAIGSVYALAVSESGIAKFYENSGFRPQGVPGKRPYLVFKKNV